MIGIQAQWVRGWCSKFKTVMVWQPYLLPQHFNLSRVSTTSSNVGYIYVANNTSSINLLFSECSSYFQFKNLSQSETLRPSSRKRDSFKAALYKILISLCTKSCLCHPENARRRAHRHGRTQSMFLPIWSYPIGGPHLKNHRQTPQQAKTLSWGQSQ